MPIPYSAELRACRLRLGLTQGALADMLGVQASTVNHYERGKTPVPEPIIRLARALVRLAERDKDAWQL